MYDISISMTFPNSVNLCLPRKYKLNLKPMYENMGYKQFAKVHLKYDRHVHIKIICQGFRLAK